MMLVSVPVYEKRPSNLNPTLCNFCEQFALHYRGGAEVELSLLFADVRGSTALAETIPKIPGFHWAWAFIPAWLLLDPSVPSLARSTSPFLEM